MVGVLKIALTHSGNQKNVTNWGLSISSPMDSWFTSILLPSSPTPKQVYLGGQLEPEVVTCLTFNNQSGLKNFNTRLKYN